MFRVMVVLVGVWVWVFVRRFVIIWCIFFVLLMIVMGLLGILIF